MEDYNIYPKQFRNSKIPIEKNRCFILMPFNAEFDIVYGNIKKSLHDNGFVCSRADEIFGSKAIMSNILNEMLRAQFIIADLTTQNPNVFYELGIAHTFKDAHNIVLMTQHVEDIPFDIRHLNHIIYDPENVHYLTSSIIKTLQDNKYILGFHEALQQRNLLHIIHDNKEGFVDYLQSSLSELVPVATNVLMGEQADHDPADVDKLLNRVLLTITTACDREYEYVFGLMQVLFELLIMCNRYAGSERIITDLLHGDILLKESISHEDRISHQTDLAIKLASNKVKLTTSMNWLIAYLSNSKSASIDLNRYKVERFFMITNDPIINSMIIDSIFNENCYVREHMADIIGEKRLLGAEDILIKQLAVEDNYYSAISLISAIGKLGADRGVEAIMLWIEGKEDDIIETKQFFVLKHSHIALSRLDKKFQSNSVHQFEKKYGRLIKDYFIL